MVLVRNCGIPARHQQPGKANHRFPHRFKMNSRSRVAAEVRRQRSNSAARVSSSLRCGRNPLQHQKLNQCWYYLLFCGFIFQSLSHPFMIWAGENSQFIFNMRVVISKYRHTCLSTERARRGDLLHHRHVHCSHVRVAYHAYVTTWCYTLELVHTWVSWAGPTAVLQVFSQPLRCDGKSSGAERVC